MCFRTNVSLMMVLYSGKFCRCYEPLERTKKQRSLCNRKAGGHGVFDVLAEPNVTEENIRGVQFRLVLREELTSVFGFAPRPVLGRPARKDRGAVSH